MNGSSYLCIKVDIESSDIPVEYLNSYWNSIIKLKPIKYHKQGHVQKLGVHDLSEETLCFIIDINPFFYFNELLKDDMQQLISNSNQETNPVIPILHLRFVFLPEFAVQMFILLKVLLSLFITFC